MTPIAYWFCKSNSSNSNSNFCDCGSCNRIIEAEIGLKEMKNFSPDKLILDHLNINSLTNKFDSLENNIDINIDIVLISETN